MWWQQKEIWRGHASGFADGGRGLEPRNATLGAGNGFLWIIESKYLTHLMFNMLQPFFFFKETTHFFWLHFSWGNFHFIAQKRTVLYSSMCGFQWYKVRSSYFVLCPTYFCRSGLPFCLGGKSWTPTVHIILGEAQVVNVVFCGLPFFIVLPCALYVRVFLPYLYVVSLLLQ